MCTQVDATRWRTNGCWIGVNRHQTVARANTHRRQRPENFRIEQSGARRRGFSTTSFPLLPIQPTDDLIFLFAYPHNRFRRGRIFGG